MEKHLNDKTQDDNMAAIQRLSAENRELLEENGRLEAECHKNVRENRRLNQEMRHDYVDAETHKESRVEIRQLASDLKSANATKVTLHYQINSMRDENIQLRTTN